MNSFQIENCWKNPVNDAELLGRVLKDDLRFDDVRVERNLNVHAMDKVVADFAQRAQGADSVVFYYSGHGIKSSDRRSFLLPIDARTGSGDAPALDRQAVSAESVRDKLKAADLGRNSPYAQALAQALKRTDMPLLAQLDMVGDEVHRIAPSQAPTREGNLRADAYLVSPFGRITPQQQGNLEDEAWALCRNGATINPCKNYLEDYPKGRYAKLVRTRMEDVSAVQLAPQASVPPNRPDATDGTFLPGQVFKDCVMCPDLVVIPAGSFQMGSNDNNDEKPPHRVSIRSFALGKYEVTQKEWMAVMGSNPSRFKVCGDNCPVDQVSWDDIQQYIQKLNASSGQQYRFPSEAEWEYAARAGTTTSYFWGDNIGYNNANCYGCNNLRNADTTVSVGQFKPNAFGLHDMHGNVWEWVQDYLHDSYSGAPTDGSAWLTGGEQKYRVLRGGSVRNNRLARVAFRSFRSPGIRDGDIGFRLARTLPTP